MFEAWASVCIMYFTVKLLLHAMAGLAVLYAEVHDD